MGGSRSIGYAGLAWALSYLPIHLYWSAGGTIGWLGIHRVDTTFALSNVPPPAGTADRRAR